MAGAYTAPTLNDMLGSLPGAERSFATDLVYGTLRWLPYLDAALGPRLDAPGKLPPDVLDALRIGTYEKLVRETPPYALVDTWVEIVKGGHPRLAPLVNAVLRRVESPAQTTAAERAALPGWLFDAFEASLGEDALRAAQGMLEAEPLWLFEHRAGAAAELEREGATVTTGPLPHTLAARLAMPLADTEAFRAGWVQPQNPASTLPARLLAPRPGERTLDLAAGRGVKTAQLAAAGADVTAVERSRRRSRQAASNLERLGLRADHVVADLTEAPALEPATKVLLDAPCTGTGTLRGHPEIKLRLTRDDVASLADLQRQLLDTAAALTASGGRLVYAVCSLLREEGEAQIESFLERHDGFSARPVRPSLPHRMQVYGTVTLPIEGLDGFYVALLERGGAEPGARL